MAQPMIPHPFEIKASASTASPDELMITWGNTPRGSVASIYLPAVAAADIIALADSLYVKHRLTVVDPHTIQCEGGDVTFVPVPEGQGRYAGLLSVDLPPSINRGDSFTIAVRQLTQVTATITPPPQTQLRPASETNAPPQRFSWRQVLGAFQYTVGISNKDDLLYPEERLLAWLKWRIGVTPASSRWLPVLQRYLQLTEIRVTGFGGNPASIPPSQSGNVPKHRPPSPHPIPPCEPADTCEYTGKVTGIHYDRFGDFRGFTLLTDEGHEHRFRGHERAVEERIHDAWTDRTVISVLVEEHDRHWPVLLTLRRWH